MEKSCGHFVPVLACLHAREIGAVGPWSRTCCSADALKCNIIVPRRRTKLRAANAICRIGFLIGWRSGVLYFYSCTAGAARDQWTCGGLSVCRARRHQDHEQYASNNDVKCALHCVSPSPDGKCCHRTGHYSICRCIALQFLGRNRQAADETASQRPGIVSPIFNQRLMPIQLGERSR